MARRKGSKKKSYGKKSYGKKSYAKKGRRKSHHKRNSFAGLTRKQLIARLRSAQAKAGGRRRKSRGLTYSQKRKYGLVHHLPADYLAKAKQKKDWEAMSAHFSGDPRGKRKSKKGKKGKGRKRTLSAWQRFIKNNSHRKVYRYKTGKLNLGKMAARYRKTPAYKKAQAAKARKAKGYGKKGHHKRKGHKGKRKARRDHSWF